MRVPVPYSYLVVNAVLGFIPGLQFSRVPITVSYCIRLVNLSERAPSDKSGPIYLNCADIS